LYNKENLITALLDKTLHENFSHIKGLKHVKQVILTPNTDYIRSGGDDTGSGGKEDSDLASPYMCPVTQLHFNGVYSFVVLWSTGYVLSEKALREIGAEGLQLEYGPFSAEDVVGLLPSEEELCARRAALEAAVEMARKKGKEAKKRGRDQRVSEAAAGEGARAAAGGAGAGENGDGGEGSGAHKSKKTKQRAPVQKGKQSQSQLDAGSGIVEAARSSVAQSKGKSALYDKLFHKDGEKMSGRDLFTSVAGIRYTL
jgi:hypothetical protein